jgi:hypothetical protein
VLITDYDYDYYQDYDVFDRVEHCGLIHIVRIEEMSAASADASAGASA